MPEISVDQIYEIAQKVATEKGYKMPDDARKDFYDCLGNGVTVNTCAELTMNICSKIDACLEQSTEKHEQYAGLLQAIRTDTKWHIFDRLRNLDQAIMQYLASLEPGQNWNVRTLILWLKDQRIKDPSCESFSYLGSRKFTPSMVNELLGGIAAECLKKNPFTHNTKNTKEYKDVDTLLKRNFEAFMAQLPEGARWSPQDYKEWNTLQEKPLKMVEAHVFGNWDYILRNIISSEDLRKHPFYKMREWNDERYKKEFDNFMRRLDSEGMTHWTLSMMSKFSNKLYERIVALIMKGDNKWQWVIKRFISPEDRKKHEFIKPDSKEMKEIKEGGYKLKFRKFMRYLDKNGKSSWSPHDLQEWSNALFIRMRKLHHGDEKWKQIIERYIDPEDVRKHPLKLAYSKWSESIYRQKFKEFMKYLEEQRKGAWTLDDLKAWSPEFYSRMSKNRGKDKWNHVTATYIDPEDVRKHPLKLAYSKWSEAIYRQRFKEFMNYLDGQGKIHWTPTDLQDWSSEFFMSLHKSFQGKEKWKHITEKCIDPEDLTRHPLKRGHHEWNEVTYMQKFKEFMRYLDEQGKTTWTLPDLEAWNKQMYAVLRKKFTGRDRWKTITEKYLQPADLVKHPLITTENWSDEKIRSTLAGFFQYLRSQKIREWSFKTLLRWRVDDVQLGRRLITACLNRNQNWLTTLVSNISGKDLKEFRFTHSNGKTLPEAPLAGDSTVHNRRVNTSDAEYISSAGETPEQSFTERELNQRLEKAIAALPTTQRKIIEGFLRGKETNEIDSLISTLRQTMLSQKERAEIESDPIAVQ